MSEASEVVDNWKNGKKIELCRLTDSVLSEIEQLVRGDSSKAGRDIRNSAEYAWHEKYGRGGGYSGDEDQYGCGGY